MTTQQARHTLKTLVFTSRSSWTMQDNLGNHYAALWREDIDLGARTCKRIGLHDPEIKLIKDQEAALHANLDADGYTTFVAVQDVSDDPSKRRAKKWALMRGKLNTAAGGVVDITDLERLA